MQAPPHARQTYHFGGFELDPRSGELRKDGMSVRLPDQPFRILMLLLARPGEVVTRDEVRQTLWPGDTFVDFDVSLNSAIKRLRDALDDSAESPRFVETLPRRGYRFLAAVEAAPHPQVAAPAPVAAAAPATAAARRPRSASRAAVLIAVAAVVIGLAAATRGRWRGRPAPRPIRSIAVLPFENLSGDPEQEYFVDGMTDAVTTDLAQARALRVISRTSAMQYKKTTKPLRRIAEELDVDEVLGFSGEIFEHLGDDPRFQDLVRRMRMPVVVGGAIRAGK